jgi:hypothetical protein
MPKANKRRRTTEDEEQEVEEEEPEVEEEEVAPRVVLVVFFRMFTWNNSKCAEPGKRGELANVRCPKNGGGVSTR